MLEADPEVLQGEGPEPLARHLRECPACQERAMAIVLGEADLSGALVGAVSATDPDRILEMALDEGPRTLPFPGRRAPRRWARRGVALLPLAAAASLAILLMGREPPLPGRPYTPRATAPGLDVQAPDGEGVAVLETNDPDITVLWLF